MDRDFYSILNIPRDASKKEIRKAYLRLARQYEPSTRKQFEDINQAYTILFDDESRVLYNHYFEEEERDEEKGSWWRYPIMVSLVLGVSAVLAYSFALYVPTIEQGFNTAATTIAATVQSKQADVESLQRAATQAFSGPKPSAPITETAALPTPTVEPSKPEPLEPPSQNAPSLAVAIPEKPEAAVPVKTEPETDLSATLPTLKPAARNYELLAFYSLVVGDLTQFKNAIKLAHQEDSSFSKLNALYLSIEQLDAAKLSPDSMLQVLRNLVFHKYSERLLPSQIKALEAYVQDGEAPSQAK
jgi:curved DNA-binding protein CbpA